MFNNKPYLEVNREERFFCFVLGHAVLSSELFRKRFFELIESKKNDLNLTPSSFEVFVEIAILRDYWNDLGDPEEYSKSTHEARETVIKNILSYKENQETESLLYDLDLFWTTKEKKKLRYPGRWNIKELKKVDLDSLIKVKWAFNCKPDIMICSNNTFVLIEAKLESDEGKITESGYKQYDIQSELSSLVKNIVPYYADYTFENIVLANDDKSTEAVSWSEIYNIAREMDDGFARECLLQLGRFVK